jgi:hypothetical protein
MLDLLGIVFSSGIMFLVIMRAVQMDVMLPWFRPPRTDTDSSGLKLTPRGSGDSTRRHEATRGR